MDLESIIGLGKKAAEKLNNAGFTQVEDLISLTASDLKGISQKTGIPFAMLDEWQEHADLMQIIGINPNYANALNQIGIDSVKELSRRNAVKTQGRLMLFVEENPDLILKVPKIEEIKEWISAAKTISKKSRIEEEKEDSEKINETNIPSIKNEEELIKNDDKSIKNDDKSIKNEDELIKNDDKSLNNEEYGEKYWNNNWDKATIIYTGRALRGQMEKEQIDIDVKTFLKKNDAVLEYVVEQYNLKKEKYNQTALACQKFVCEFLKYSDDEENATCPEFWQFPFESLQSGEGDCEDGAILIAGLMINAGIPSWRVRVCAGDVEEDPTLKLLNPSLSNTVQEGGHCYTIYLADRPDSSIGLDWVILDWCYYQDPDVDICEKPLARDGGQNEAYKEILFSFNDEYCWAQKGYRIIANRVGGKDKPKIHESVADMDILINKLFDDLKIQIDDEEKEELMLENDDIDRSELYD